MALDVITYDKVDEAEKNLGNKIDGLNGTVEGLPQEVQDQLDAFKATIDELKKNVEDTLADVQETVENSPAGIAPPMVSSMTSESTEDGIKLIYTANAMNISLTDDKVFESTSLTKGIMFRYSNKNYPVTTDEGTLAFIDEDLFDISDIGVRTAKEKTNTIVGLTNNETYYISAFPYSYNNVYNLTSGTAIGSTRRNRTKCQWTGTKGTLTVNVTQDYDYKPLGEYTATLTPTAGGEPVTKMQSGATTIVFSGLEAGEYMLSFTDFAGFIKPVDQTITVIAGQSQIKDANYLFDPELDDLTFEEIQTIVRDGRASEFLSIGQEKTTTINLKTIDASDYSSITESNVTKYDNAHVVLVGFNIFGSNEAVFMSKGMAMKARGNSDDSWLENKLKDYLNEKRSEIFPDAFPYMKNVTIKTCKYSYTGGSHWAPDYNSETGDNTFNCYISPLSAFNLNAVTLTSSDYNEGGIFPYFTNNSRRKLSKTDTEDYGDFYYTRSLSFDTDYRVYRQYRVSSDGSIGLYSQTMDTLSYYPLFFVIG